MTVFETKCPKCGKLITIDFIVDDEGDFYCSNCNITFE
ncbi:hypothetical protein LCGC14_1416080, partial [marine sediment metagenome]